MQIEPTRLGHVVSTGIEQATGAPAASEATATQGAQGAQPAAAPEGADRLALSQQASEIRAAHEALAALPDTRTELVARLKDEVAAGAYQINPDAIAEQIVP